MEISVTEGNAPRSGVTAGGYGFAAGRSSGRKASLLLALLLAGACMVPGAAATDRGGEIVPFFQAEDVEGNAFDLRALAKEKTVLIFFWNTYKTMSIREMNMLNDLYGYFHPYGFEVIAIEGSGKDRDATSEDIEKLKIIGTEPSYAILPDPGGRLFGLYRVGEVPETFVIGRNGQVLYHLAGFREEDSLTLETRIKDILGLLPAPVAVKAKEVYTPPAPAVSAQERKKGVTIDPEQQLLEKYRYFGKYYFNRDDFDQALENFSRCLDIDPKATDIRLMVGQIHARRRQYEEAREAWERVLDYDPSNREADALIRQLIRGEF